MTTAVRTRSEAPIEQLIGTGPYRDGGCPETVSGKPVENRFPSCLTCPLAECQFEVPTFLRPAWLDRVSATEQRERRIVELWNTGRDSQGQPLTAEAVAMRIGCSTRTVHRALERRRQEEAAR